VITVLAAIACVLVPQSWFWIPYFVLTANATGSIGDIYVSLLLTRMPKDALVFDNGASMQIYSREDTP